MLSYDLMYLTEASLCEPEHQASSILQRLHLMYLTVTFLWEHQASRVNNNFKGRRRINYEDDAILSYILKLYYQHVFKMTFNSFFVD